MSFLQNVKNFLQENVIYERKTFTFGQWEYIQKILSNHQFMIELMSKFSSPAFDQMYDASVLKYEGVSNHAHDLRYVSRNQQILEAIEQKVQQKNGQKWVIDNQRLVSGFYRKKLLAWPEISNDPGLQAYVKFLFDYFEKNKTTVVHWVALFAQWGGETLPKDPFLLALKDSEKAYDDNTENATFSHTTYSCLLGIKDRIARSFSYLYTPAELPESEQPLSYRYVHAVTSPFICQCDDNGWKPTPLLYSAYLLARFEGYEVQSEKVVKNYVQLSGERFEELKTKYAHNEWKNLLNTLKKIEVSLNEKSERVLSLRHCFLQTSLAPWRALLSRTADDQDMVTFSESVFKTLFSEQFTEECQDFQNKTEVSDFVSFKLRQYGLESEIFEEALETQILHLGAQKASHEDADEEMISAHLTQDLWEMLTSLPGVDIKSQLERWVDNGVAQALPLSDVSLEFQQFKKVVGALEKDMLKRAFAGMRTGNLAIADYYQASHSLHKDIKRRITDSQEDEVEAWLKSGSFFFAQDSIMAEHFEIWLRVGSYELTSAFDYYHQAQDNSTLTVAEVPSFVSNMIDLGYDQSLYVLIQRCPEIIHLSQKYSLDKNDDFIHYTLPEAMSQRPLPKSTDLIFSAKRDSMDEGYDSNDEEAEFGFLYEFDFFNNTLNEAIAAGNLSFVEAFYQAFGGQGFVMQWQKMPQTPCLLNEVIKVSDRAIWQWFCQNFHNQLEFFESKNSLTKHPVIQAVRSNSMRSLQQTLKLYPNFLDKFFSLKEQRYPAQGIAAFFKKNLVEPLSQSVQQENERFIKFLVQQPCYRKRLFCYDAGSQHFFLIKEYFFQALQRSHFRSGIALLEVMTDYLKQYPPEQTGSLQQIVHEVHAGVKDCLKSHIGIGVTLSGLIGGSELQQLVGVLNDPVWASDKNWLTLHSLDKEAVNMFHDFLTRIGFNASNSFAQNAAQKLWEQRKHKEHQVCLRIKNLKVLLHFGVWPAQESKSVVVEQLTKHAGVPAILEMMRVCAQQGLMEEAQICMKHLTVEQKESLAAHFIDDSLSERNYESFSKLSELIAREAYPYKQANILSIIAWSKSWGQRHKSPNQIFEVALLSDALGITQQKAQPVHYQLWKLKGNLAISALWSILKGITESTEYRSKLEILLCVQKAETPDLKIYPNILVESVMLGEYDFADHLAENYPALLFYSQGKQASPLRKMMTSDLPQCWQWALSQSAYINSFKNHCADYVISAFRRGHYDKARAILTLNDQQRALSPQKLSDLWRRCGQERDEMHTTWTHYLESYAREYWSTGDNIKKLNIFQYLNNHSLEEPSLKRPSARLSFSSDSVSMSSGENKSARKRKKSTHPK